jgi:hypothetical protein
MKSLITLSALKLDAKRAKIAVELEVNPLLPAQLCRGVQLYLYKYELEERDSKILSYTRYPTDGNIGITTYSDKGGIGQYEDYPPDDKLRRYCGCISIKINLYPGGGRGTYKRFFSDGSRMEVYLNLKKITSFAPGLHMHQVKSCWEFHFDILGRLDRQQ